MDTSTIAFAEWQMKQYQNDSICRDGEWNGH